MQAWEYAVVTWWHDEATFDVAYFSEHDVADEPDQPHNVIDMNLGHLGGKGWELVSVTESPSFGEVRGRTVMYLKRPHDPERGLKE